MKPDTPTPWPSTGGGRAALATGFVSAILASTCCLGPLLLITLGFSGAWISNLTALEPYRPLFIGAALVALFLAGRRIWTKTPACEPGHVCAVSRVQRGYKLLFGIVAALVIVALGFPLVAPWFY
ncbi:MAG TPA: mercuric ion transporter MerT [Candidatus Macondimonas sp.]|nr:mercuric ion transporter MerT [Candidatus Macondimonas sp.]